MALPGVVSANLSPDAWTHTPVVPLVHTPVPSQRTSAFAMSGPARLYSNPYSDFRTGDFTGLQSFAHVQASGFAPPRSLPPQYPMALGSRGLYVRAYDGSLPPRPSDMLAVRIGQLTAWGLPPTRFAALPAAPPTISLYELSNDAQIRAEPVAMLILSVKSGRQMAHAEFISTRPKVF